MACNIVNGRQSDGRPYSGNRPRYRVAYERHHGIKLPRSTILHHTCGNAGCMNVAHLEPMTQGAHIREHGLPGDWGQRDKTHCPAGHEYTDANTYRWRNERQCRICRLAAKRRYNAKVSL